MHLSLYFLALLSTVWGLQNPLSKSQDVSAQNSWEYSDCGTPTDAFQIESLSISPDPPKPGSSHELTLTGRVTEFLEDGLYAKVQVKLGLIKLISRVFDVCQEFRERETGLQCPISQGSIRITEKFDLPKEIPPAKYKIEVEIFTVADDPVACTTLEVDFTSKSLRAELK